MKKRVAQSILFLLCLGILSSTAYARGPMRAAGPMFLDRILQLNLTDSQEARLKEVFNVYRPKQQDLLKQLQAAEKRLHTVVEADTPSEPQIRSAFQQVSSVREDLLVQRTRMLSSIRTILSPQQLEQIQQWRKESRRPKHGKRVF